MHVLLPPSEGKTPGGRGRRYAELIAADGPVPQARRDVAAALAVLLGGDPSAAAQALVLPPGVATAALATNAALPTSRTSAALNRYAGVVYDGLDVAGMDPLTRRVAGRSTLIFSGLLGVVRGAEAVPDYRVPAKAVLPGVGVAGTFWRPVLEDVLPGQLRRGLVLDLRSSDYTAMWRPPAALRERVLTVQILSPLPRGGFGVISHTSKLMKGRLAAALLRAAAHGAEPASAQDVAAAWSEVGGLRTEHADGRLRLLTRTATG